MDELSIVEIERIKCQIINEMQWSDEEQEEEENYYCCCIC